MSTQIEYTHTHLGRHADSVPKLRDLSLSLSLSLSLTHTHTHTQTHTHTRQTC